MLNQNTDSLYPKILVSGSYNAFEEGWNGNGVYMGSGLYKSKTFKNPIYIGSAWREDGGLQVRIEKEHICSLERNKHPHNPPFQIAWNNHSKNEGFIWWLLEPCTKENQLEIEQKWLSFYRPFVDEFGGFNIAHYADAPFRGRKHTDATKEKLSKLSKNKTLSEDHKRKLLEANKNKKVGKETRDKMAKAKSKDFKIISPEGDIINGHNLRKFCRESDLNQAAMLRVLQGKVGQHKGYRRSF